MASNSIPMAEDREDEDAFVDAYSYISNTLGHVRWRWAFYYRLAQHYIPSGFALYRFLEAALLHLRAVDKSTVLSLFRSVRHKGVIQQTSESAAEIITFLVKLWIGEYMGFVTINQWISAKQWITMPSPSLSARVYAHQIVYPGSYDALSRVRYSLRMALFSVKTTPPVPLTYDDVLSPYTYSFPAWFSAAPSASLSVTVTSQPEVADAWVALCLQNQTSSDSERILGIDTETDQNVVANHQNIDLIQLATYHGQILLYMVSSHTTDDTTSTEKSTAITAQQEQQQQQQQQEQKHPASLLPHGIRYVLEDNTFMTKVGCACDMDAFVLYHYFSIFPRRMCDLQYCIDQLGLVGEGSTDRIRRYSLADIVHHVLNESMHCTREYGKKMACSQWRQTIQTNGMLTKEQMQYAAMDAFACVIVYVYASVPLRHLPDWIIQTPPRD